MSAWARVSMRTKLITFAVLILAALLGAGIAFVVVPEKHLEKRIPTVQATGSPCRTALKRELAQYGPHLTQREIHRAEHVAERDEKCKEQSRLVIPSFCRQYPSPVCREILRSVERTQAAQELKVIDGEVVVGGGSNPSGQPGGGKRPSSPGSSPGGSISGGSVTVTVPGGTTTTPGAQDAVAALQALIDQILAQACVTAGQTLPPGLPALPVCP